MYEKKKKEYTYGKKNFNIHVLSRFCIDSKHNHCINISLNILLKIRKIIIIMKHF